MINRIFIRFYFLHKLNLKRRKNLKVEVEKCLTIGSDSIVLGTISTLHRFLFLLPLRRSKFFSVVGLPLIFFRRWTIIIFTSRSFPRILHIFGGRFFLWILIAFLQGVFSFAFATVRCISIFYSMFTNFHKIKDWFFTGKLTEFYTLFQIESGLIEKTDWGATC